MSSWRLGGGKSEQKPEQEKANFEVAAELSGPPSGAALEVGSVESIGIGPARTGSDAVVGELCSLRGTLESSGKVLLDCEVEGEVRVNGELIIGEAADIKATVIGASVKVYGQVSGDILARDLLELHVGARVSGNIASPRVLIQDGVVFEGSCSMSPDLEHLKVLEGVGRAGSSPNKIVDLKGAKQSRGPEVEMVSEVRKSSKEKKESNA